MASSLPFLGRRKEISALRDLHWRRKHVLILGAAGIGKSALIAYLRDELSLLVSSPSEHLGEICAGLESQLGLNSVGSKLLQRKQQAREALAGVGRTVVFDGVSWTTPKLSSFLERVAEKTPVWICTRSERPWDIGHFWPLLVRFTRVELPPFHLAETQALVEAAVQNGLIPPDALTIVGWLQRRSGGSPLVLHELVGELATGRYDLSSPHALRRLDLDRRIHEVFPLSGGTALASDSKTEPR